MMNPQLLVLFVLLNGSVFALFRHFITIGFISEQLMTVILMLVVLFIIIENINLFVATRSKNLNKLLVKLNRSAYRHRMAFLYLFYCTISLASVTFSMDLPDFLDIFIITFVLHYFLLAFVTTKVVHKLLRQFRYGLQDADTFIDYVKQFSPHKSLSSQELESHGQNRLSLIEIKAIDELFRGLIGGEVKKELRAILYPLLLLWSKLLSFLNAALLATCLSLII